MEESNNRNQTLLERDNVYSFNLKGYDPFLDYLKGVCILFVVLTHALPFQEYILFPFWGGQAVPLFLLIQSFHFFKKTEYPRPDLKKTWKRIVWPFLLQNVIAITILTIFSTSSFREIMYHTVECGGNGPGSYYVWVYLQFVILLPLLGWVYKRYGIKALSGVVLGICVLFEVLCSYINPSPYLYRLLCFRYFSLPLLAIAWVKHGLLMNKERWVLSIVGIVFLILLFYCKVNLDPVFFNSEWYDHHWICFLYTAFLFAFLLFKSYRIAPPSIISILNKFGKYSYDVFLWQMLVFKCFSEFYNHDFINHTFAVVLKIALTVVLSFVPVYYKVIIERFKKNEA